MQPRMYPPIILLGSAVGLLTPDDSTRMFMESVDPGISLYYQKRAQHLFDRGRDTQARLQMHVANTTARKRLADVFKLPSAEGISVHKLFGSPMGHLRFKTRKWASMLQKVADIAKARFHSYRKSVRDNISFSELNNGFYNLQNSGDVEEKLRNPSQWSEMYKSKAYKKLTETAGEACTAFMLRIGKPGAWERQDMWFAVYPEASPDEEQMASVGHKYHMHPNNVVSFVIYLEMPIPSSPLVFADPRGLYSLIDFNQAEGVLADAPFHRELKFFVGAGDLIVWQSSMIHRAHHRASHGGTRVALAGNCQSVRKDRLGIRWDQWLPVTDIQKEIQELVDTGPYIAHAYMLLHVIQKYIVHGKMFFYKMLEVKNTILALLQFGEWLEGALAALALFFEMRISSTPAAKVTDIDVRTLLARAVVLHGAKVVANKARLLMKGLISNHSSSEAGKIAGVFKSMTSRKALGQLKQISSQEVQDDLRRMGVLQPPRLQPVTPEISLDVGWAFATQVAEAPMGSDQELLELAEQAYGISSGRLEPGSVPSSWTWNPQATLTAVACASGFVLLADPRGFGMEDAPGHIPSIAPKAPFHWPTRIKMANKMLVFPAWLRFVVAGKAEQCRFAFIHSRDTTALLYTVPEPGLDLQVLERAEKVKMEVTKRETKQPEL